MQMNHGTITRTLTEDQAAMVQGEINHLNSLQRGRVIVATVNGKQHALYQTKTGLEIIGDTSKLAIATTAKQGNQLISQATAQGWEGVSTVQIGTWAKSTALDVAALFAA